MRVLFVTNLPAPYRVSFFNELGKYCDLTVCYERKRAADRDEKWVNTGLRNYTELYAAGHALGADQSIGLGIAKVISRQSFDALILAGYSSPSMMLAIGYCRIKKIPYWMEYDGGFDKEDPCALRRYKQFLLRAAQGHFTTCEDHQHYLERLGIAREQIYRYPFTSVREKDCLTKPPDSAQKTVIKRRLGLSRQKAMVLSVGQFIPRKGMDVLLDAAGRMGSSVEICIVGGAPTPEYRQLIRKNGLNNVRFVPFMSKKELTQWYQAADLFVLPTREDIWGLVINEAMANGLPVITTQRCIAGLEMVREGENGFLVPSDAPQQLADRILQLLNNETLRQKMACHALQTIRSYTIESMVQAHRKVLCAQERSHYGE